MSKHGATIKRTPDAEEPVPPLPPVKLYAMQRDGPGWRVTFFDVPANVVLPYMTKTHEPDIKGIAMDKIMRDIEERSR